MSVLDSVFIGLSAALQPSALMFCLLGVTLGTVVGILPGIGSLAAISMLMPLSFHLEPQHALIMLAGVYYGTLYGGSTVSILLNLPGSPSSAVACLDGYPMAKQGRAGVALAMTTIGSFVGAAAGIILMIMLAPAIAAIGLRMTAADYFALLLLGLVASSTLAQGSPVKGIAMVVAGIFLGLVGTDVQTGQSRFTMGTLYLADGVNLVALSIGLFGIPEMISNLAARGDMRITQSVTLRSLIPTRDDIKRSIGPMLRGIGLGSFVGALPGAGTNIASFMSYALEKNVSSTPERFGKGAIEGVVAPETSNNAAAQTAFIPTMSLGIPGDATMALLLGVLIMHGIQPGPRLVSEQPVMFWSLIMSFWIGNILLVILNLPLIGIWVRLLSIPRKILIPSIFVMMCIGVYSINNNPLDVLVMGIAGLSGFLMRRRGFEPAPLILGFILGPLMDQYFRRALAIARGDLGVMASSPTTAALLLVSLGLLLFTIWRSMRRARAKAVAREGWPWKIPMTGNMVLGYLTLQATPVETVEAAAAAGFASCGVRLSDRSARDRDVVADMAAAAPKELARRAADLGVRLSNVTCYQINPWLDMEAVKRVVETTQASGAPVLVVNAFDVSRGQAVDLYAGICAQAETAGIRVAFEFIPYSAVKTLGEGLDCVRQAKSPAAALAVDLLHLCRGGDAPEALETIEPDRIGLMQVCDATAQPDSLNPDALRDEARTARLPLGLGRLPVSRFLLQSARLGADLEYEVPAAAHKTLPAIEKARQARRNIEEFMASQADHQERK